MHVADGIETGDPAQTVDEDPANGNPMIGMKAVLAVLMIFPVVSAAQVPQPVRSSLDTAATPITLAEAIRMAQQNAPATVQARGEIQTSSLAVKQAYSQFLPSINLS